METVDPATEIIGQLVKYYNALPAALHQALGALVMLIALSALPKRVTRFITEGSFQYITIALAGALWVFLPFVGVLHGVQRDWPIVFLIVFWVLFFAGSWAGYRYIFIPLEDRKARAANVGVSNVEDMAALIKKMDAQLGQYDAALKQANITIAELKKKVPA